MLRQGKVMGDQCTSSYSWVQLIPRWCVCGRGEIANIVVNRCEGNNVLHG